MSINIMSIKINSQLIYGSKTSKSLLCAEFPEPISLKVNLKYYF